MATILSMDSVGSMATILSMDSVGSMATILSMDSVGSMITVVCSMDSVGSMDSLFWISDAIYNTFKTIFFFLIGEKLLVEKWKQIVEKQSLIFVTNTLQYCKHQMFVKPLVIFLTSKNIAPWIWH